MPARRYIVSPQGGGPLVFSSGTLPAATMGQAYSQNVSGRVSAGLPAYAPFTLLAQTGADGFAMTPSGTVTGTPASPRVRVTNTGAYRVTNIAKVRSST